jgi:hypothetical protein
MKHFIALPAALLFSLLEAHADVQVEIVLISMRDDFHLATDNHQTQVKQTNQ